MTAVQEYPPLAGWLTAQGTSRQVEVRYASKFSLWAVFEEEIGPLDVDNLDVRVGDRTVCLGPCRTLAEADGERVVWLLPSPIVHDLESLFAKEEVLLLGLDLSTRQSGDSRDAIDPDFRRSLSELTGDLNAHMIHLDRLDAEYRDELPVVRAVIQANIIERVTPGFNLTLDTWNKQLIRMAAGLSPFEREHYGVYFRRQLWSVLLRAPVLAQTNLRRQNDPQDPETLKMIYLHDYQGDSTFGKLLHKYMVELPTAQAVRNLTGQWSDLLQERLRHREEGHGGKLKVLSVTCGAALEWLDLLKTAEVCDHVALSLLDQDPVVLALAEDQITRAGAGLGVTLDVDYLGCPVPEATYDFIYSLGLLDSLADPVARAVVQRLYGLLNPGGDLILSNVTSENPDRLPASYWTETRPHDRTEKQCLALVPEGGDAVASLSYDATKTAMLLRVKKKAYAVPRRVRCEH